MMFVAMGVFVVVVAVALVLLMSMAIGAFSAMFTGMKNDRSRRRTERNDSRDSAAPAAARPSTGALGELADELRLAQARRWASCQSVQRRIEDQWTHSPTSGANDYLVLALDLWHSRSPGNSDPEETGRAEPRDRLGDWTELAELSKDRIGKIVWTTALVADSVNRYPAWKLDFFDRHSVRVDLVGEVTAITTAAAGLRDQLAILGDAPVGHLGVDDEVIATFVEKSRLLSGRLDGLVTRLEAFADYEQIVARIQQRQEKQAWLERVSAIDEFEHVVDAERDRAESDRVRNLADESEVLASIYLDEIAPLAKSLKQSDAA
ncbi:hypothetical protein O0V02_01320 [Gordonia amicalis]|uniref:hypothetical protein n=1 Tax=Gordonia amicalis TaxID=89053 RepID=UPI0022A7D6E5|nr:hypothetical protein [Gordonia amicalis]MCZ0911098.1 hypothetical protein [Gordonia amicalis]